MLSRHHTLALIAVASLISATAAQANKGASYQNNDAEAHFKWFVKGGATYLSPSYDSLEYFASTSTSTLAGTVDANSEKVSPGYDWGYFLAAGYKISNHYDIQTSWTALNTGNSDGTSVTGHDAIVILSDLFGTIITAGEKATAHSSENLTFQAFDATIGQYHTVTDHLSARVLTGIRYAKIDLDIDNSYTITGIPGPIRNDYDSSFSGWGPEAGMDLEYKVYKMLNLTGHLAAAFLIGTQEASSSNFFDTTPTQINIEVDKDTRIVPALDAKLGLSWNNLYKNHNWGLGIEGGYQVAYYFDAAAIVDGTATSALGFGINHIDVSMMGPYLNVNAMF
jgi:hypothetical protein